MRGRDYSTTLAFLSEALRGDLTPGAVELVCLPNEHGAGKPQAVTTREPDDVVAFLEKYDRPGWGCYFGIATRPAGKTDARNEDCLHLSLVPADIDFKSTPMTPDEVDVALMGLPIRPRIRVHSGGGLHLYWPLKEAIDCQADKATLDRREAVQRLVADCVAGDPIHDVRRVMRLPGTQNDKHGASIVAEWSIDERAPAEVTLEDLEEAFGMQWPLVTRRDRPARAPLASLNVFERIAQQFGRKARVDVEEAAQAMSFGGGEAGIHNTQLRVTAALLTRGAPLDDVVAFALECTQAAVPPEARWNWAREEKGLRRMCAAWIKKHPPERAPVTVEEAIKGEAPENIISGRVSGGAVVSLAQARAERQPKPKPDKDSPDHVRTGKATIEVLAERGMRVLATEGEWFLYEAGLWRIARNPEKQMLRSVIREAAVAINTSDKARAVAEVYAWITERPELLVPTVPWDQHGLVMLPNGAFQLASGALFAHAPEHYARTRLAVPFKAGATCPLFLTFLDEVLANLSPEDRAGTIQLLQEWFGVNLIKGKKRRLMKALFLLGPASTGKTTLAGIFRAFFEEKRVVSLSVTDLNENFSMSALHGKDAWIRDDAVRQNDTISATERFKVIVVGEHLEVNKKGKDYEQHRFEMGVLLTMNALPKVWETSEAIKDRLFIVKMSRIFREGDHSRMAQLATSHPSRDVLGMLLDEMPGILNWAIEGARRAVERGCFVVPANVEVERTEMHREGNPINVFIETCVEPHEYSAVMNIDLVGACNAWLKENAAYTKDIPPRTFLQALRTVIPTVEKVTVKGDDGVTGIRLNDTGLNNWEDRRANVTRGGATTRMAADRDKVNRPYLREAKQPKPTQEETGREISGKARF